MSLNKRKCSGSRSKTDSWTFFFRTSYWGAEFHVLVNFPIRKAALSEHHAITIFNFGCDRLSSLYTICTKINSFQKRSVCSYLFIYFSKVLMTMKMMLAILRQVFKLFLLSWAFGLETLQFLLVLHCLLNHEHCL